VCEGLVKCQSSKNIYLWKHKVSDILNFGTHELGAISKSNETSFL